VLEEGIQDQRDNHTRFIAVVSQRSGLWRRIHAIRGATSVEEDDPRQIADATRELLGQIVERNSLEVEEIVSVFFTVTQALISAFPALAAREADIDLALIGVSAVLFGISAAITFRHRALAGMSAWFASGCVLYLLSIITWRLHAPVSAGNGG